MNIELSPPRRAYNEILAAYKASKNGLSKSDYISKDRTADDYAIFGV